MYADRVAAGRKRSVKERLNGDLGDNLGRSRQVNGKRQRQDDKWKHDLFEDHEQPSVANRKIGAKDLRLKLQKKVLSQQLQGSASRGMHDLREKLSSPTQQKAVKADTTKNADTTKKKAAVESVKPVKKISQVAGESGAGFKKAVDAAASTHKKAQIKDEKDTVDSLLKSLDLEKYLITFQAEEIDMTALMHMNDADLKALGIPMGPRKKILLALDSKA